MLRPRESYDQWLIESRLDITPEPAELRWTQDVFGNAVAHARFVGRARALSFESSFTLEHDPVEPRAIALHEAARSWPFAYATDELPDLARSIERCHPDPDRTVEGWARGFAGPDTAAILEAITHAIRRDFTYLARDSGTQTPLETLRLRRGTCRDFAALMMEGVRALGFAARFVSGYVYSPALDRGGTARTGAGSTHAWVRVYLPGPGWVEYDPTNGIVGNRDLIRVAVARDPAHAAPLTGTFTGFPSDFSGMEVSVSVTAQPQPEPDPRT